MYIYCLALSVCSSLYVSRVHGYRDGEGSRKKKRPNNGEIEALFSGNAKRSKKWISEESTPLLPIKDKNNKLIQRSQKLKQGETNTGAEGFGSNLVF